MNMEERRTYRMGARAHAAEATADAILDATVALFWEQPTDQIRLDDVAQRAGVHVQTVIRRFGGRDGLFAAAAEREQDRVRTARSAVPAGDLAAAVDNLVAHYEQLGDRVLAMLTEERGHPGIKALADQGRTLHRDWCAAAFDPTLQRLTGAARTRRLAQIVAICDVHTWHLLRRDQQLSRRETARALTEMLQPLI